MAFGRLGAVWPQWRSCLALALLILGFMLSRPVVQAFHHVVASLLHLRPGPPHMLGQTSYAVSMVGSLLWEVLVFAAICGALGRSPTDFPIRDRRAWRHTAIGLGTGLLVMAGVIGAIRVAGAASIAPSGQSPAALLGNTGFWLVFDYVGAAGEELFARGSLLLVSERLLGWQGAVIVSGLVFFWEHTGNPGASPIWLFRLFLQGMLLAYAVFRTRSLWWSIAYHTGWNWVSAPLFGAAGSGYLDQNHAFDFVPKGSSWITGGDVGPEGSVFAFLGVLAAFGLLLVTTRRDGARVAA